MVKKGDKINTDFNLQVIKNSTEEEVAFKDLLDRPTVVSVYMKNNTPGCDRQNQSLVEHAEEINKMGYNIVAVSKDSCRAHENYAQKFGIGYTLASDPDYLFSKATDSIVEKRMYGKTYKGPSRSAFVIGKDGTVLDLIEKVDTKRHGEEVINLLKSLG
ncbi:MAG TPA: redoxin domain-containing protein [Balneolales bacterium]|nr:redoxin domain-containing protein [Balneolales bacterium]